MKSKIILLGMVLGLLSFAASAQSTTREKIKRHEVARSFRNGKLTGPEVHHLARHERRISHAKHHARRDGRVTHAERRRIHHLKKHQRRRYLAMKHNGRRRFQ